MRASFLDIVLNPDCISEQYANETSNATDHDRLNNQDREDDAGEPTASFEEDPGDTDDSPMSVEARVSLSRTYRMPLLVALWVWILIGLS